MSKRKPKQIPPPPKAAPVIESAFPIMGVFEKEGVGRNRGMTLRDWFASRAPAMPDEFAESALNAARKQHMLPPDEWQGTYLYLQAKWSYRFADAMLKAREAGEA